MTLLSVLLAVVVVGGDDGPAKADSAVAGSEVIKIGVIGLDTSHAIAFTKDFNHPKPKADLVGFKVVAAYPKGSPDIESSVSRVPGYVKEMKGLGVAIVESIDDLLKHVDAVLLETNDGRPHPEQLLPVLKAGKPCFVDKPVADSLVDAIRMYEAAEHFKTPIFSSSSLRYVVDADRYRNGEFGKVLGADTFSPCSLEKTHPDLFWYGIHGVETLFTVMGPKVKTVSRTSTADTDVAVGVWDDGRVGVFRGMRTKIGYGGHVFAEKKAGPLGGYAGYRPLVVEIGKFFKSKQSPVTPEETIAIYAFMEAADESKRQGGKPVDVQTILEQAKSQASKQPLR